MKKTNFTMEDLGEFNFIRSIQNNCHFSALNAKLIKGIGDDCAVIGPYDGNVLLITTDLLLEDVHFILNKITPEHLGQKAVCVNLSDIAAMGGKPRHLFISLAIPKRMNQETIFSVYQGIKAACKKYSVNILGGDTSASQDRLLINITVIGEALEKEVLYRSGARPGDEIYVTGTIGDSAAGLKLILGHAAATENSAETLIQAHHLPVPFVEVGRIVAQSRLASAMIDLSDGLVSDLQHICESSHVGACLFQDALPLSKHLKSLAEANGFDPFELALFGGEDYRLIITVPEKHRNAFKKLIEKQVSCNIFRVGVITEDKGMEILRPNNIREPIDPKGFDHFMSP